METSDTRDVGNGRASRLARLSLAAVALLDILFWIQATLTSLSGLRRMTVLKDAAWVGEPAEYPKLTAIVPARDEEAAVGESIERVLRQDYPDLEVIAVDDRSTDRTGEILHRTAGRHPNLEVLRVDVLPSGWLGKTHALNLGASRASGEWLLFADADVLFAPECFRLAVAYAVEKRLDHMTLVPHMTARGPWLKSFIASFQLVFSLFQRPWKAEDSRSPAYVGVGAFNLVRRSAYEASGTHKAIALRPDDDMKLAKLLKKNGCRAEVVFGRGLESVEWQQSVRTAVRGLEKSAFPGMDYKLGTVLAGSCALLLTNVLPFAGVLLAKGQARVLFAASVLAVFGAYAGHSRYVDTPLRYAILHPFGTSVLIYATVRSAYLALANRGLEWRGTFYPLDKLKRNIV